MDWIKVKVKHAEYDFGRAPGEIFKSWIMTMMFVAATEKIPTPQQLVARIGADEYQSLITYIADNDLTPLEVIMEKVMEDVNHVSSRKEHDRKYMSEYRCKTLHKPLHNALPSDDVKGKRREDKRREDIYIIPPSLEEVSQYCLERKNGIMAAAFIDYYQARGWMIGKHKMKDWKAAVRTWEQRKTTTVGRRVVS